MARLDSASRLRRRIMVSMTSLRNRIAAAPSPSSPLRSRYSQAIWNESSSSWESETVISKKPTRTVRVIIALSVVLKIRRTLTGQEIDDLIANTCAGFELAAEHRRRADWRKRELAANSFQIECDVNVASLPRPAPDRVG